MVAAAAAAQTAQIEPALQTVDDNIVQGVVSLEELFETYDRAVERYARMELYLYIQLITRQEVLAFGGKLQKTVTSKVKIPDKYIRTYWKMRGMKVVEKVLRYARQRMANSMKKVFIGEIVDGRRESWPMVDDITQGRSNDNYMEFAVGLLPCLPYMKSFKDHSGVELLRNWYPVHLEAFAVALYKNGYHAWSVEAHKKKALVNLQEDEDDDISPISSDTNESFPFTAGARGAKRFQGWKDNGVTFYNDMVTKLDADRAEKETGTDFEVKLMNRWLTAKTDGGGGEDLEGSVPMALNGLDMVPV